MNRFARLRQAYYAGSFIYLAIISAQNLDYAPRWANILFIVAAFAPVVAAICESGYLDALRNDAVRAERNARPAPRDEARHYVPPSRTAGECVCGRNPNPGICPSTCSPALTADGHCRCACTTNATT